MAVDLIPTAVMYYPDTGKFECTIKNQGTTTVPATAWGVKYSTGGIGRSFAGALIRQLTPGQSITLGTDGPLWFQPTGGFSVQCTVDDTLLIAESNETNNLLQRLLTTPYMTLTGGTPLLPPEIGGYEFPASLSNSFYQQNSSSTGVATQARLLVGTSVTQNNTESTGAIKQIHILTSYTPYAAPPEIGAYEFLVSNAPYQENFSSTGVVTQNRVVSGSSVTQANSASTASITQIQIGLSTPSTQANYAPGTTLTQLHVTRGLAVNQANIGSVGAITQQQVLASFNSIQTNLAESGPVMLLGESADLIPLVVMYYPDIDAYSCVIENQGGEYVDPPLDVSLNFSISGVSGFDQSTLMPSPIPSYQQLYFDTFSKAPGPRTHTPGTYTISVTVDIENRVIEKSDANNVLTRSITIPYMSLSGQNGIVNNASATGRAQQRQSVIGSNCTQSNILSTGRVQIAQNVTGATATQTNSINTGLVVQARLMTGLDCIQNNSNLTGIISQRQIMFGSATTQNNAATTGNAQKWQTVQGINVIQHNAVISGRNIQFQYVFGFLLEQLNYSTTGLIKQLQSGSAPNVRQNNFCVTGRISQSQTVHATNSVQRNRTSTGIVTGPRPLNGYGAVQRNKCSTGKIKNFTVFTEPMDMKNITPKLGMHPLC
jgi:hypothetical protein